MFSAYVGRVEGPPLVFIVEDDLSVRESLELLVAQGGWHAESFASASDFLAYSRSPVPSCLLLDVHLPDINGLDLQKELEAEQPCMPIIFITGYGDVPMTVRAMKAGAAEFLTKPLDADSVLAAIGVALDCSHAALRESAERQALLARYQSLTPREREVMALVVTGLLNKQVGFELGISEITVKEHRGSAMRKMGAGSLPDLVHMSSRLNVAHPAAPSVGEAAGSAGGRDRDPKLASAISANVRGGRVR